MYELKPTHILKRSRTGGLQASGYVYDRDADQEFDVVINFDYSPAQPDRTNADKPNPGPGSDESVEVTSVSMDSDQNEQIDVSQCQYDPVDFIELADDYVREQTRNDVSWARRVAGM